MATPRPLAEPAPHFEVRILGPFEVYRDGVRLPTERWQKRIGRLFKVLATAPDHRLWRDELIEALWPDTSPQAGANNLRLLIHLLRQALASGLPATDSHSESVPLGVATEAGWVALHPDQAWEVDLDRFERLAHSEERRCREAAASLYRGEPLPEDRYDDWAAPLRERIERTWRNLLLSLARDYGHDGSPEAAVGLLERVLDRDPLDEEVLRELLSMLGRLGRRAEALRRYRQFERRLDEELGLRPEQETLAIVAEMWAAAGVSTHSALQANQIDRSPQIVPVTPRYPFPSSQVLVGREAQLETILQALADRQDSQGGEEGDGSGPVLFLIEAEAGMGKSRLLDEVALRARERGILTLAGGCYEQEGRLPYGSIHDSLLDYIRAQPRPVLDRQLGELIPDLLRIIPEARGYVAEPDHESYRDGEDERLRLFAAITRVLERIVHDKPLVLLLDDLHWADDATLHLLHFLHRQASLSRVCILGAYRAEEVPEGTVLAQIAIERRGSDPSRVLSLDPLGEADLAAILEDRLGDRCAERLAKAIHDRSAGNPFFAVQMLRLLQQEGRLSQSEGGWDLRTDAPVELPEAVREVVTRRLRQLDRAEREILTLAAVLGREFGYPALESMWRSSEEDLCAALDGAAGSQVLDESESGYVFRHPVLWEVVYRRIPSHRRPGLHRRAALALEHVYGEQAQDHAAELAWHFRASGQKQRALCYALQAGDRAAAAFAHVQAEEQYAAARDLACELGDDAAEREALERLGRVLRVDGQYDNALEHFERAARMWHEAGDLDAEGRVVAHIGWVRFLQGMESEGPGDVQSFLDATSEQLAGDTLAALHSVLSNLLAGRERPEEHLMAAVQASQRARSAGESGFLAEAEVSRGQALRVLGRHDEALRTLKGAIKLAEGARDFHTLVRAFVNSAQVCAKLGELASARSFAERGLETATRQGDPLQITYLTHTLAEIVFSTGDWDEARHLWEQAIMAARSLGPSRVSAWPLVGISLLCLRHGRTEEATQFVAESVSLAEAAGRTDAVRAAQIVLAERDLMYGDPRAALDHVAVFSAEGSARTNDYLLCTVVALAHLALGDSARAEEVVRRGLKQATARRERPGVAQLQWVQGKILGRLGRWEEAERDLNEAVLLATQMPYPFVEALALCDLGNGYLERGKGQAGRERLQAALAIFRRLGAHPDLQRTERALANLPMPG